MYLSTEKPLVNSLKCMSFPLKIIIKQKNTYKKTY